MYFVMGSGLEMYEDIASPTVTKGVSFMRTRYIMIAALMTLKTMTTMMMVSLNSSLHFGAVI